uniref:ATP-binding protein n=1 Tax=Paractinoplanes polyasparticus TaxID=2856853 RepID=UPI001C84F7D4|nr:ATP-binding protein [Actinoplanes polyasparticus]
MEADGFIDMCLIVGPAVQEEPGAGRRSAMRAGWEDLAVSLVGRAQELAAVRRLLDRAAAGLGGQLIVSGPPGSGKTAIADVAATEARARGLTVTRAWDAYGESGDSGLLVLDDLDRFDPDALAELRRRSPAGPTAVLVTVTKHLPGVAVHLRLMPLTPAELAVVLPGLPPEAVHALWLASAGWPGTALELAAGLPDPHEHDVLVELALEPRYRIGCLSLHHPPERVVNMVCGLTGSVDADDQAA